MTEPALSYRPRSLADRVIHELLEQSTRLATGAVLLCTIYASANHDPGPDIARALAVYWVRLALPVFLLSFGLEALERANLASWIRILGRRRNALDEAVRLLFVFHWIAVAAYLYVARIVPGPWGVVGGAFGAVAILVRPALAKRTDARSPFRYRLSGDVIWLVFVVFYARVLIGGGAGKFSTPREATGYLLLLGFALACRVWGRARRTIP